MLCPPILPSSGTEPNWLSVDYLCVSDFSYTQTLFFNLRKVLVTEMLRLKSCSTFLALGQK